VSPDPDDVTTKSEIPSLRLQVAAAYFGIGGLAILVGGLLQLLRLSGGTATSGTTISSPLWALVLVLTTGATWLGTSWALHHRRRSGLLLALVAVVGTIGTGLSRTPLRAYDVAFVAVAPVLLASTWRELDEGGS
jgi:hypothetical protein